MKKEHSLLFKEDIGECKAGFAYKLQLTNAELASLVGQGCIFASKDAKYYKEEKKEEVKKVAEVKPTKKVSKKDVTNKDTKQAKVQAESAKQD